jgi:hypothetical protein
VLIGSDLRETRANDPRDCGSSGEVTPRTDKDSRRRRGPDDLARRDRNPALSTDRLHTSLLGEGAGGLLWALVCTVLMTIGEIYVFSGSLSLVTRVAPVRIVSLMVGVWFLSTFVGTLLAGLGIQVYWRMSPESFFPLLLGLGFAVGVGIWLFNKPSRGLAPVTR